MVIMIDLLINNIEIFLLICAIQKWEQLAALKQKMNQAIIWALKKKEFGKKVRKK